ncbi:MAG: hypothetical protein E7592_00605 [Ruminococcaceae bacterium]|nr:hypothetical protein [Oscillospiraceae bacterium]
MKKRILAIVLACLMIFSVVSFVACDDATEEHAEKIATLETATDALKAAIETKASASDLNKAVADFTAELEKAAAKGDVEAVQAALAAVETTAKNALDKAGANATAIEALNAAVAEIEAALEAAESSVGAGVADLEAAIADLGTAITEIQETIALLATKAELEEATKALQEAIDTNSKDIKDAVEKFDAAIKAAGEDTEAVKEALAAVKATADDALAKVTALGDIEELLETVATLKELDIVDVEGLEDALKGYISITDWDKASAKIHDYLKTLNEEYSKYEATKNYYTEEAWDDIELEYDYAILCLNRAYSVENLGTIVENFKTAAADVKLIIEQIAEKLNNVDTATLGTLKAHYEAQNGKSLLDEGVDALIATADENLAALYNEYMTEYTAGHLPLEGDGSEITAQVGTTYQGYVDALDAYKDRKAALETAEEEANEINALIVEYAAFADDEDDEINNPNTTALNALKDRIAAWDETYFADFANDTVNYGLVHHAEFDTLYNAYWHLGVDAAGLLAEFAESLNFEVTLLSKPALDNSLELYNAYTDKCEADGTSLDYEYNDHNGAYYLVQLLNMTTEYNTLVEEAQAAYDEVYENITVDNVTIYDMAAIEAMLAWYDVEEYGLVDNFATEVKVTGTENYVTKATRDDLLEVKAACQALVDAKNEQTNAVNALLAALPTAGAVGGNSVDGFIDPACAECAEAGCEACNFLGYNFTGNEIKLSDKEAIENAREAYDAWLNGTSDQDKINLDSELFVIDAEAYVNLERAEHYMLNWLESLLRDTVYAVKDLDGTNPDEDAYAGAIWLRDMLVAANCGDTTCLTGVYTPDGEEPFEYDVPATLAAYELAVYKLEKLEEVEDLYEAMKADLESVELSTTEFTASYTTLCGLINAGENMAAVDSLITAWKTEGAYKNAEDAYMLAVAKNEAKATVEGSYNDKVAEYEAAGKDADTLANFENLYKLTCNEIDNATSVEAVSTVVTRWNNERVNLFD